MITRKHPIIRGLVGLILALAIFFFSVLVLSSLMGSDKEFLPSEKIAVVPVNGIIIDSQTIIDQLRKFKKNSNVKAVVVRIDSPGGGVGPSQEIYEEIKKVRKEKTVVASIGSIGASGGYYVACAANKIMANPGTIIGSIAVIVQYTNIEELMEKIGLKGIVIKSGKYKDIMSPLRDIDKEERELIQNVIDDIHNQFVSSVAEERHLEKATVEAIADGRIFTGLQAKETGLIDEIGTFYDAIDMAAEMAGIEGEPKIIYPEKKFSFSDYFFEKASQKLGEILCSPYRFSYLSAFKHD